MIINSLWRMTIVFIIFIGRSSNIIYQWAIASIALLNCQMAIAEDCSHDGSTSTALPKSIPWKSSCDPGKVQGPGIASDDRNSNIICNQDMVIWLVVLTPLKNIWKKGMFQKECSKPTSSCNMNDCDPPGTIYRGS